MPRCQVIKANNRACRNYARKGLTCCYPHRNLETDTCEVITTPVNIVKNDIPPPPSKIETFEINPWDDDDIWEQIIAAAYQGPEAFADGLDWIALCTNVFHKGDTRFVFHKSLKEKDANQIIKNSGAIYDARLDSNKQLVVYISVI
jgi:hypothetical protein